VSKFSSKPKVKKILNKNFEKKNNTIKNNKIKPKVLRIRKKGGSILLSKCQYFCAGAAQREPVRVNKK